MTNCKDAGANLVTCEQGLAEVHLAFSMMRNTGRRLSFDKSSRN